MVGVYSYPRRQQGAVLVLCMVILMIMTLMASQLMASNVQQMKIAGSAQLQTEVLEDAEQILREAEQSLISINAPSSSQTAGAPISTSQITAATNAVKAKYSPGSANAKHSTVQDLSVTAIPPYDRADNPVKVYSLQLSVVGARGTTRVLESMYRVVN